MADESNPPTDASEGNQGGAGAPDAGSAGDGAQGGASSTADAFAAERAALEARARDQQSRADKAEADRQRLEARIAELEKPAPTENSEAAPLTAEQIRRETFAAQQIVMAAPTLKDEFTEADPAIFGERLVEFESVEALRAAAEASHSKRKAEADALREKVEAEVRKEFAEKHGIELELGPPEPTDSTPTGDPTLDQLNKMSQDELDALEKARPGVISRVSGAPAWGGGWNG